MLDGIITDTGYYFIYDGTYRISNFVKIRDFYE